MSNLPHWVVGRLSRALPSPNAFVIPSSRMLISHGCIALAGRVLSVATCPSLERFRVVTPSTLMAERARLGAKRAPAPTVRAQRPACADAAWVPVDASGDFHRTRGDAGGPDAAPPEDRP
jgi:hypothetical protein